VAGTGCVPNLRAKFAAGSARSSLLLLLWWPCFQALSMRQNSRLCGNEEEEDNKGSRNIQRGLRLNSSSKVFIEY
jgi:hypothetical protein